MAKKELLFKPYKDKLYIINVNKNRIFLFQKLSVNNNIILFKSEYNASEFVNKYLHFKKWFTFRILFGKLLNILKNSNYSLLIVND